ncbi:hypothetical protein ACFFNY_18295 [Paenibacillus hodogayensis]|uniref:Uncharacterized protein n=1 Tax=Paenibacillus hodogayensis TaxID=279208 RepID=A0ABV5VZ82_9BACL
MKLTLKQAIAAFSLLLFVLIGLFTVYSFVFPFEAGDWLQGGWFGLILLVSPFGILMALFGKRAGKSSGVRMAALTGHLALIVFVFLYMSLGYVLFGV